MIARWNIRVRHAYAGLLWVGGPQVDPGYAGYLFCPIYNLSDKPVTLYKGEPLALMDFSRTLPFDPKKSEGDLVRYKFPPTRVLLEDFNIIDFQSALFTRAGRKIGLRKRTSAAKGITNMHVWRLPGWTVRAGRVDPPGARGFSGPASPGKWATSDAGGPTGGSAADQGVRPTTGSCLPRFYSLVVLAPLPRRLASA